MQKDTYNMLDLRLCQDLHGQPACTIQQADGHCLSGQSVATSTPGDHQMSCQIRYNVNLPRLRAVAHMCRSSHGSIDGSCCTQHTQNMQGNKLHNHTMQSRCEWKTEDTAKGGARTAHSTCRKSVKLGQANNIRVSLNCVHLCPGWCKQHPRACADAVSDPV